MLVSPVVIVYADFSHLALWPEVSFDIELVQSHKKIPDVAA